MSTPDVGDIVFSKKLGLYGPITGIEDRDGEIYYRVKFNEGRGRPHTLSSTEILPERKFFRLTMQLIRQIGREVLKELAEEALGEAARQAVDAWMAE